MASPSSLRYEGKVVIVTGGARGIGQGIASVFVHNGAKVIILDKLVEEGRKTAASLSTDGPGAAEFMQCDITKEEEIQTVISRIAEKNGQIDCLVNNAGWHEPYTTIDQLTAAFIHEILNINVVGSILMCKHALPHLRLSKGNIISIASMAAHLGQARAVAYSASKGAVGAYCKSLALEEAPNGVRVNVISPGPIHTPLFESMYPGAVQENAAKRARTLPIGRLGTPEDVGKMALYLAADAHFCTGADMLCSGGEELNYHRFLPTQSK